MVKLKDFLPSKGLNLTDEQASIAVTGICVDTRKLKQGNAFFALHGHQFDGRPYIDQAIDLGASSVFLAGKELKAYWRQDVLMIEWPSLLEQASQLAAAYFEAQGEYSCELESVMAVTGTNGKTTCSHLYAQLWHLLGKKTATIGTLGSGFVSDQKENNDENNNDDGSEALKPTGYTTPDAITLQTEIHRLRQQQAKVLSLEASSHSLHQYRMAAVPVSTAVFTNLTRDHLDYHGTMAAYAQSKARLFDYPQVKNVVINADDPQGADWLNHHDRTRSSARWFGYSLQPPHDKTLPECVDFIYVTDLDFQTQGIQATLHSPWGAGQFKTRLIGHFNLSNLLAVVVAALAEGADFDAVLAAIPNLTPVKGRMDMMTAEINTVKWPTVAIDYAHTPDALEQALSVIRQHATGDVWCVFGCGGDRDGGKRPLMGEIAARLANHVIVTNDNPRSECPAAIADAITKGMPTSFQAGCSDASQTLYIELDRAKAIRWGLTQAKPDDWILIAGKGHEDYQIMGDQSVFFSDHEVVRLVFNTHVELPG